MALKAMEIEEYVFTSPNDKEEPKTRFTLSPMRKMEQFKVSAVVAKMFDDNSGKGAGEMVTVTDETERVIYGYLREHLVRVENFGVSGELVNGEGKDYVDRINPTTALEIVSDAVKRSAVDAETEKN